MLDAKLGELETEGDDKRFEDAREELSSRLAEVHARLSEMDAESGPARAASLLAGIIFMFSSRLKWQILYRTRV
jgi:ATP-binding cassette subfamily F protein 3